MVFPLRVLLVTLVATVTTSSSLNVALIPSSGCYSHDVMMKQVGQEFGSSDNVTWIQAYLYEFGFGEISLPEKWSRISLWGVDEDGKRLMEQAGNLLWEQNVPTDFDRPWDLRGSLHFIKILERHQNYCEKMLLDRRFVQYMKTIKTDVVVLDHFLQECMGGLSHLLNASVVQFSNWPIADGYITSLNVPANPSATPKTGTPFSGLGMTFLERVSNVLFHSIIVVARVVQVYILDGLFARHGYPEVRILQTEADRVIHAGRSEFLFDVVRPISNRVKHFGGASIDPKDFVIALPEADNTQQFGRTVKMYMGTAVSVANTSVLASLENCTHCDEKDCREKSQETGVESHLQYRSDIYTGLSTHEVEQRFTTVQSKFPGIEWETIRLKSFILVSFGSVAKVENMPLSLLRLLLATFQRSRHEILWQTNSDMAPILKRNNITLPGNTRIISWAPIKELLAHPNLQYIVCHGGINTVNELLLFGVPVVGVPLQGDQGSNLRRLVDLGAAEVVSTVRLKEGDLELAMKRMEANLGRYWKRASRLSSMVRQYRTLHQNDQRFWLNWTARNGRKMKERNIMRMQYIGDKENAFWLAIGLILTTVFVFLY